METNSWVITMRCVVRKTVICDGCDETSARADPWEYATDEWETDQIDWEIESIKPNE